MTELLVSLGMLSSLICVGFIGYSLDKKSWNRGMCRRCKAPWKYFDTDSQGGRGYKCGNGHYTWISWLKEKEL